MAEEGVDILIYYGEASKYVNDQAIKDGMNPKNIYDVKEKNQIIDLLKQKIKNGDVLLFKASNGMKFFDLATEIQEFI